MVIAAERRGDTPEQLIQQAIGVAGDQEAALSSIGLPELVHGIYRAPSNHARSLRQAFVEELRVALPVYPYTDQTALLAGRIDGEQAAKGFKIPFSDLLIGATALSLDFSVLTANAHHCNLIPGLQVIAL